MIMLQLFSSLFSASDDFLERFAFCILFVSRALLEAFCLLASSPGFRQQPNEISSRLANGPRPNVETIFLCWFCEQIYLCLPNKSWSINICELELSKMRKQWKTSMIVRKKELEKSNQRLWMRNEPQVCLSTSCFYFKVINVEHRTKRLAHVPHSALQFIFVSLRALR